VRQSTFAVRGVFAVRQGCLCRAAGFFAVRLRTATNFFLPFHL
jgi:hypothetical protein